ncbi:MAG: hypothetical protein LBS52_10395 [Dysgonamonadaceae bacterium]|jgi:hypothetical protein|nr:hypothetical protein [Dysgonamonadaceae bacterium]
MEDQITTPPPVQPTPAFAENNGLVPEPMSVKDWVKTMLICIIPIVNIIMLFVWAFGDSTNKTRSNWAKAQLVLMAIGIVLYIIILVVVLVAGFSLSAFG